MLDLSQTPDLETPRYTVLRASKDYEIRRYDPFVVAEAPMGPGSSESVRPIIDTDAEPACHHVLPLSYAEHEGVQQGPVLQLGLQNGCAGNARQGSSSHVCSSLDVSVQVQLQAVASTSWPATSLATTGQSLASEVGRCANRPCCVLH